MESTLRKQMLVNHLMRNENICLSFGVLIFDFVLAVFGLQLNSNEKY